MDRQLKKQRKSFEPLFSSKYSQLMKSTDLTLFMFLVIGDAYSSGHFSPFPSQTATPTCWMRSYTEAVQQQAIIQVELQKRSKEFFGPFHVARPSRDSFYESQMKKVIVKKVVYLTIFLLILDLVNSLVLNLLNRRAELCDQMIVYANSSRRK